MSQAVGLHLRAMTIVAVGAFATTGNADVIAVPGDAPGVQAAIDLAVDGDEIVIAAGTWPGPIDFSGKTITVRSIDPSDPDVVATTIIDGQGLGTTVRMQSGEGPATALRGLTITGGVGNSAGTALAAGGLYVFDVDATIEDCRFVGNTAFFKGGGVLVELAAPTIRRCEFIGNVAGNGGGMAARFASAPMIDSCTFVDNTATVSGGGYFNSGSAATVINCAFETNTAEQEGGGGLYTLSTGPTVSSTGFCANAPDDIAGTYTDAGENGFFADCGTCPADLDENGAVDVTDLITVILEWGSTESVADLNGDGTVNVTDLVEVILAWGTCG